MTTEWHDDGSPETPAKRYSGRKLVLGFAAVGLVLFGFVLLLATRLTPAADRFHNKAAPTLTK